ncbi:MAG: AAA family ATPase [Deltaproteobacteria bacterium]|nr:AAA family ATPase [Deltaproteobacteria bacterium]
METDQKDVADNTELLIESVHSNQNSKPIIINPLFLDDENLSEEERIEVLSEIFNQNIRQDQLKRVINHLAPILSGDHPASALIYGPTGSGKTVSLIHVLSRFKNVAQRKGVSFDFSYIDLTMPKTTFSALNETAISLDGQVKRYRRGIPIDLMAQSITDILAKRRGFMVLLIDEINNIKPSPDDFLTFLAKTLPRKVPCRLVLIMLTNRLDWDRDLDPRLMSVLKKAEMVFEPYNARDLIEILKLRVAKALDPALVDEPAVGKIAAFAARDNGDARKAVQLLAKSARIAQEAGTELDEKCVDRAKDALEIDKTESMIRVLALHQRLALEACYHGLNKTKGSLNTGGAYRFYQELCSVQESNPLTQRRFSELLGYLDLYGLIGARTINKGRYGNTREISGCLPAQVVYRMLSGETGMCR